MANIPSPLQRFASDALDLGDGSTSSLKARLLASSEVMLAGAPKGEDYFNAAPSAAVTAGTGSRLVPALAGINTFSYAALKPGEAPTSHLRRIANNLPDLNVAGWTNIISGSGVAPVVTVNAGTDPIVGPYARVQLSAPTNPGYALWRKQIAADNVPRRVQASVWVRTADGSTRTIIFSHGVDSSVYDVVTVDGTWRQIVTVKNTTAATLAHDYGIVIGVRQQTSIVTSATADLHIAIGDQYGPMVEVLADELTPRPYAKPGTNYGFGANGVRVAPPAMLTPDFSDITFYDDFARTTPQGSLGVSPQGLAWDLRGTKVGNTFPNPGIGSANGGAFEADGFADTTAIKATYATIDFGAGKRVTRIGARLRWEARPDSQNTRDYTAAMILTDRLLFTDNMVHFIVTPTQWFMELWLPDTTRPRLAQGSFNPPLAYGVDHLCQLDTDGTNVRIIVPRQQVVLSDARVASCLGQYAIWEHYIDQPARNLMYYDDVWAKVEGYPAISAPAALVGSTPVEMLSGGLRPLPARTVSMLWTGDVSNAAWTATNVTATAATSFAPRVEGAKLVALRETTTVGTHGIAQATGLGAVQQTGAAVLIADTRQRVRLRLNNPTDGDVAAAVFDLASGTVVSGSGRIDRDLLGDGAVVVSITGTPTVAGTTLILELVASGTTTSYAGNTAAGLYVHYLGAEAGGYFSGPILTQGAAASRTADLADLGAILTGGSLSVLVEVGVPRLGPVEGEVILGVNTGGALLRAKADGTLQVSNGIDTLSSVAGKLTPGLHKLLVRRANGLMTLFCNGSKVAEGAISMGITSVSRVYAGSLSEGSAMGLVRIKSVRAYQVGLSDATCKALTA